MQYFILTAKNLLLANLFNNGLFLLSVPGSTDVTQYYAGITVNPTTGAVALAFSNVADLPVHPAADGTEWANLLAGFISQTDQAALVNAVSIARGLTVNPVNFTVANTAYTLVPPSLGSWQDSLHAGWYSVPIGG